MSKFKTKSDFFILFPTFRPQREGVTVGPECGLTGGVLRLSDLPWTCEVDEAVQVCSEREGDAAFFICADLCFPLQE